MPNETERANHDYVDTIKDKDETQEAANLANRFTMLKKPPSISAATAPFRMRQRANNFLARNNWRRIAPWVMKGL
jgi:hypothetical protein